MRLDSGGIVKGMLADRLGEALAEHDAYAIDCAGDLGEAGNWRILAWRSDALLGRSFVDIGEADPLHCVQVIQIAPELLEAVCSGERCSVIPKVFIYIARSG